MCFYLRFYLTGVFLPEVLPGHVPDEGGGDQRPELLPPRREDQHPGCSQTNEDRYLHSQPRRQVSEDLKVHNVFPA